MIKIIFNHTELFIEPACSLSVFLEKNRFIDIPFAVALNDCLIQRTQYCTTLLKENDVIDIITPMQGG